MKKYFSKVNVSLMIMLDGPQSGNEYEGDAQEEQINFTVDETIPF